MLLNARVNVSAHGLIAENRFSRQESARRNRDAFEMNGQRRFARGLSRAFRPTAGIWHASDGDGGDASSVAVRC